jgi:hypothetical protein
MIIGTYRQLVIGKVYSTGDLSAAHGDAYDQPFKVMREATKEEWINYAKGLVSIADLALMRSRMREAKYYFYEIEAADS